MREVNFKSPPLKHGEAQPQNKYHYPKVEGETPAAAATLNGREKVTQKPHKKFV